MKCGRPIGITPCLEGERTSRAVASDSVSSLIRASVDETARRSEGRRVQPIEGRALGKKKRQFLAKPAGIEYCFSESPAGPCPGDARQGVGAKGCEGLGNGAASH